MKLSKKQIEDIRRLYSQVGKCRAWIDGFQIGSKQMVLEQDALRQVQLLFKDIMAAADKDTK